ncbi:stilbene synthase [Puniceicoccus vermicola]|uniref:Stilbene synthase n=1 Tax=Puniceicoccus vermicola TaxID=388746 RepID=A0A7X1AZS1_9BACT|nr:stilbene synthase [Puniceicoccus vermicola]
MILQGIASSVPSASFSQSDCWEILRNSSSFLALKGRSQRLLEKVLNGENGIEKRHFAMPEVERLFDLDAETLNRGFEREAPKLGKNALEKAMNDAGVAPGEIDALLTCTCTGYLCPGISSYVAEQMGMRSDIFLSDMVGLGCGAAVPMLRQADALARANPSMTIACVAVEICSAAFYLDDDPGVLISLCLFGDGASATIWKGGDADASGVRCSHFDTLHLPEYRNLLRFENSGGKLKNRLDRAVPEKASIAVKTLFDRHGDPEVDIVSHAGGRDVLEEISKILGAPDLSPSREVLRQYGNMSSPSVLFAFEDYLRARPDEPFHAWATSFGAGFACHSCRFDRE